MTAHTRGPWRWVMQASGIGEASDDDSDMPALVSVHGPMVCWFGNDETYYPTEGIHPNAADMALIAAAPVLLAALRAVLFVADRETEEFSLACAAIAKATLP